MENNVPLIRLFKQVKVSSSDNDLLSYILSFLSLRELKIFTSDMTLEMRDIFIPKVNMLLYGQVQSGKTGKIIEFINTFKPHLLKILIVQNSKTMLSQYCNTLKSNNITYFKIDKTSYLSPYTHEKAIITIYNKNRMNALEQFMERNLIDSSKYCLILDESDQYFHSIKHRKIFTDAKNVLHVTATPFLFTNELISLRPNNESGISVIDKVIAIKPKENYYGLHNVKIKELVLIKPEKKNYDDKANFLNAMNAWRKNKIKKICKIAKHDFITENSGFMLITCFSYVKQMIKCASKLSKKLLNATVVVASTETYVFTGGKLHSSTTITNMQSFISKYNNVNHLIIIANRMANRGINYTNLEYDRNITHQISGGTNHTSFMQKCRIFGNRNGILQKSPKLYCFIHDSKNIGFVDCLKSMVQNMADSVEKPVKKTKLTVKQMKKICKKNKIKGFSKLGKNDLMNVLLEHNLLD
jgi:hypothetical protein